MEEIRIPRNSLLVIVGLIMGPVAIIIGMYFYSLADGPNIGLPSAVQLVGIFIALSGLFATALSIRELISPSTLVINENGISSSLSFGFVPWDEIVSIELYERLEGAGQYAVIVKGLLIKVKNPEKILGKIRGLKKFGTNRSFRLRGSPIFIPDVNWSWKLDKIHEKLQTYWGEYSRRSQAGEKS